MLKKVVTLLLATTVTLSAISAQDIASIGTNLHNVYRNLHRNTPPLSTSSNLVAIAQFCSNYNANRGFIRQDCPQQRGYGSNMAVSYGYNNTVSAITDHIRLWYQEIRSYRWSSPVFSSATGHFTQLVWASSRQVGCAVAVGGNRGYYTTCIYSPPGNYPRQFLANVLPLK